jgi:hypothetical protein
MIIPQDSVIPKDKTGQAIQVGSYIAYGHAMGRSAGIRIGKVLRIEPEWIDDYFVTDWKTKEQRLHKAAHYEYRIKVWGCDDDHGGFYGVKLNSSAGFLSYPDRILVIEINKLPPVYLDLLGPIEEGFKKPKDKS